MKNLNGSTAILALLVGACVTPYAPPPTTVSVGPNVSVPEGGTAFIPITKTGNGSAKFTFQTVPGTADATDFVSQSGTVTTAGGATLAILTRQDESHEGPEDFKVILGPKGSTTIGDGETSILIIDDDAAPPQPIHCWDGSTVIPPATCPVQPPPVQCWDGSTVQPPATCPVEPPKPVTCWDLTVVTPPATCPVEPPKPPSGNIPSNGIGGLTPVNSVDPTLATKAAGIPASGAPDVVGAFRFTCGFAGLGKFDPKVYPGDMTGKSHGHQFYGNTHIYPYSSYETLRTEGPSTCAYGPYPANRTAYWQPWLEDGLGHVLQPDYVTVYYKRTPPSDPSCAPGTSSPGGCVAMPQGLFFIFGYDFLTQTIPTGAFDFTCQKKGGPVAVFKDLAAAAADKANCVAGAVFSSRGSAPKCWNGTQVDSPNHRSHVGPMIRNNATGKSSCDAAHPYIIPTISVLTSWTIPAGSADLTLWQFSSDYMRPDLPKGSTFHVDIFQAWEPDIHAQFHRGCIDQLLNCSSGNLGTGRAITNAGAPFYPDASGKPVTSWTNPQAVVPIPGAEANTKLVGFTYGRSGRDWPRDAKLHGKAPPQPHNGAAERFERPGADPLIYGGQ
jgi:hypothetical protein